MGGLWVSEEDGGGMVSSKRVGFRTTSSRGSCAVMVAGGGRGVSVRVGEYGRGVGRDVPGGKDATGR